MLSWLRDCMVRSGAGSVPVLRDTLYLYYLPFTKLIRSLTEEVCSPHRLIAFEVGQSKKNYLATLVTTTIQQIGVFILYLSLLN